MVADGLDAAMAIRDIVDVGRQNVDVPLNVVGNVRSGHLGCPTGRQFNRYG